MGKIGIIIAVIVAVIAVAAATLLPVLVFMSTPLGIFTPIADENTVGTAAIEKAVAAVREDLNERIEELKKTYRYTDVVIHMNEANNWRDVLAVYAVLQTTGDEPTSAMLLGDLQIDILCEIYAQTHPITAKVEVVRPTTTTTTTTTTAVGTTTAVSTTTTATQTTTTTVAATKRILHITVGALSTEETAELYDFDESQQQLLNMLLSSDFDALWNELLGNIVTASSDTIADIALSQVGNVGGATYREWYGFEFWVDWCAIFTSWCAEQCGYIDSGICPKFAGVNSEGIPWFQERGLWQDRSYVPSVGDYIFIDWEMDGEADHVEIVVDVVGYTVHTVGGNRNGGEGTCITDTYSVGSNYIYGYGTPLYPKEDKS